jgi:hypothetical protein
VDSVRVKKQASSQNIKEPNAINKKENLDENGK